MYKRQAVTNVEDGVRAAQDIGYPVLVRPSFVLGGRAMQIVANENSLRRYLGNAVAIDADRPVLVDKYISGKELEVDAVSYTHLDVYKRQMSHSEKYPDLPDALKSP